MKEFALGGFNHRELAGFELVQGFVDGFLSLQVVDVSAALFAFGREMAVVRQEESDSRLVVWPSAKLGIRFDEHKGGVLGVEL